MNFKAKKSTKLVNSLLQKRYVARHLKDIGKYDADTYKHSIRVGTLVADIAYENGLSEKEVRTLAIAGLLHDLGKCDIPKEIINKKGPLNKSERKEVDKHTVYGKRRIRDKLLNMVRKIVMHHHDVGSQAGKNVKRRIKRKRGGVPFYTEMVTAADIFDALANERPYKRKFSKTKVATEMQKEFFGDKKLVAQLIERY